MTDRWNVWSKSGRPHSANAACAGCEWDWMGGTVAAVKASARRHVAKTGHVVTVLTERATTLRPVANIFRRPFLEDRDA